MNVFTTNPPTSNDFELQNNQHTVITINNIKQSKKAKKYLCHFQGCDKSYTYPSHLQNHIASHENKLDYKCDLCNKKFNTITLLKKHKKTHGPKEYKCALCDTSYTRRESLTYHNSTIRHQENIREIKQAIEPSLNKKNINPLMMFATVTTELHRSVETTHEMEVAWNLKHLKK
jgi:uncharacterized Zn-finger protein